jgi:(4S)-4-hydroxy-5-phosphonooxypentane-2,3-dione isomerase
MLVVVVDVWVQSECVQEFVQITEENAENSRLEPGIARFDVLVDEKDPTHFSLVEVYRYDGAPAEHKETEHYKTWRELAEPMMARPRSSVRYRAVSPGPSGW